MNDMISRVAAIDYLMINMGWRDEDGYEVDDADEKRAIITDLLNGVPAVDAIPVEWLKKYQLENEKQGSYDMVGAIEVTLWDWEKEQEANRINE